jgi:hypothetical protein
MAKSEEMEHYQTLKDFEEEVDHVDDAIDAKHNDELFLPPRKRHSNLASCQTY